VSNGTLSSSGKNERIAIFKIDSLWGWLTGSLAGYTVFSKLVNFANADCKSSFGIRQKAKIWPL
jgi:hypothetical protein